MKNTPRKNTAPASLQTLYAAVSFICLLALLSFAAASAATAADLPQDAPVVRDDWPRVIVESGVTFTISQPQVESWEANQLTARTALGVQKQGEKQRYGAVWFTARTDVNADTRMVLLQDFAITNISFKGIPDNGQSYKAALAATLPKQPVQIALDRLQASLEVAETSSKVKTVQVNNALPRIIFENRTSLLVLVDGAPALREVTGLDCKRVINTGVLLVTAPTGSPYYLWLADRWVQAASLDGPWQVVKAPAPAMLAAVKKQLAAEKKVDLLENVGPDVKQLLKQGRLPTIYVATAPARLIQTKGEPDLQIIPGTKLRYAANTYDIILFDTNGLRWYVLIDGRWYQALSRETGPWAFVDGNDLPPDFANIPKDSPAARALYAVPGTPQAKQAVVEATTPHTQTIEKTTTATVAYDGQPQFNPIEGTPLRYSVNSAPPVIRVDDKTYYIVQNGVWFCATSPMGPWVVATTVPQVIYTIPASSPVHYVTYVYVYGATPTAVYTGYTAGYTGTVITPANTVVYTTGFMYPGWVGGCWYPPYNYYYYDDSFKIHETHDGRFIDRGYNDYGTYTKIGDTTFARTDDGHYAAHDGNIYKRELGGWKEYDPDSGDWELSKFSKVVDTKRIKDLHDGDARIQQHREEKGKDVIFGPDGKRTTPQDTTSRELDDASRARDEGERRAANFRSGAARPAPGGFSGGGFGGGGFGGGGFRGRR